MGYHALGLLMLLAGLIVLVHSKLVVAWVKRLFFNVTNDKESKATDNTRKVYEINSIVRGVLLIILGIWLLNK